MTITTTSGTFEIDFTEFGAFEDLEINTINGIEPINFKRSFLNEVEFELGRALTSEAVSSKERIQEALGDEARGN